MAADSDALDPVKLGDTRSDADPSWAAKVPVPPIMAARPAACCVMEPLKPKAVAISTTRCTTPLLALPPKTPAISLINNESEVCVPPNKVLRFQGALPFSSV